MKKFIIPVAASLAVFSTAALAAPLHHKARSSNHGENGAASGEKGAGMAGSKVSVSAQHAQQVQAYEETYKTDKAQEEQLKSGGSK